MNVVFIPGLPSHYDLDTKQGRSDFLRDYNALEDRSIPDGFGAREQVRYCELLTEAKPACVACAYYAKQHGECRRYPRTFLGGGSAGAFYPVVADYDWCGEYKPKQKQV
jgi:hypothetical protein